MLVDFSAEDSASIKLSAIKKRPGKNNYEFFVRKNAHVFQAILDEFYLCSS